MSGLLEQGINGYIFQIVHSENESFWENICSNFSVYFALSLEKHHLVKEIQTKYVQYVLCTIKQNSTQFIVELYKFITIVFKLLINKNLHRSKST